jgi:pantoate--beta-alanine ligase
MIERTRPRAVSAICETWRAQGRRIAFVPTMGALHAGHLSLVRRARRDADRVVTSIFVNPLQFGPREDFARYPRALARDRALLRAHGVDLLFRPAVGDIYPAGDATRVQVTGLDQPLCGRSRPGHFTGVATVVLKLLEIVRPHVLWLGQKDAQQAAIVERMVRDLRLGVRVRRAPIVRDRDGLALSSRNAYLSPAERAQALGLWRGLQAARAAVRRRTRSAAVLRRVVKAVWRSHPGLRPDYMEVVDPRTLEPAAAIRGRVLIAVAGYVGRTRLIDNLLVAPPAARRRRGAA